MEALADQILRAQVFAGAAAITAAGGTGLTGAGAGVYSQNRIAANVVAQIDGDGTAGISVTALTVRARDISEISSIAGAAALSAAVGGAGAGALSVGVAVAENSIDNEIEASIRNADSVESLGNISVTASETASVSTISAAASVAAAIAPIGVAISGGAATSKNTIAGSVRASIEDSDVTAAGAVSITAGTTSTLTADIASVALAAGLVGAANGLSLANNTVTNVVSAFIDSSSVTADGGDITVAANLNPTLTTSSRVGVLTAAIGTSFAAAESYSNLNGTAEAYINAATLSAIGHDVNVTADSISSAAPITQGAGAGLAAATALLAQANIGGTTRAFATGLSSVTAGGFTIAATDATTASPETKVNGVGGVSGAGAISLTRITRTTEAYIGAGADISTGATSVNVTATSTTTANGTTVGNSAANVAIMALLVDAEISGSTRAYVQDGARISAGGLSVIADATNSVTAPASITGIGFAALSGVSVTAKDSSAVLAFIGSEFGPVGTAASITITGGDAVVRAKTKSDVSATVEAVGVSYGLAATLSEMTATSAHTTSAFIGKDATVSATAGSVNVEALSDNTANAASSSKSVGAVLVGITELTANADGATNAKALGNVTAAAISVRGEGTSEAAAGASSLGGGAVSLALSTVNASASPSVSATAGGNLSATGNLTIEAIAGSEADASSKSFGVGGLAITSLTANASIEPTVTTSVQSGASLEAGGNLSIVARHGAVGSANGSATATATGSGGGGIAVSGATTSASSEPVVSTTFGANAVIKGFNVVVDATSLGRAISEATGTSVGILKLGTSSANVLVDNTAFVNVDGGAMFIGRNDVTVRSTTDTESDVRTESDGGGLVSIANVNSSGTMNYSSKVTLGNGVVISTVNNLTVESLSDVDGTAEGESDSNGFAGGATARASMAVIGETITLIGDGSHLTGAGVTLGAVVSTLDLSATANADLSAAGGNANAFTTATFTDESRLTLNPGVRIVGSAVTLKSRHDGVSIVSEPTASAATFGEGTAHSVGTYDSDSKIDAKAGAEIVSGQLLVQALQDIDTLSRATTASGIATDRQRTGTLTADRTIIFDADIRLGARPELIIDENGVIQKAVGISATVGATTITVAPISNTTSGANARFQTDGTFTYVDTNSAQNQTSAAATVSGSAGTVHVLDSFESVSIINRSTKNLVLGSIEVANPLATATVNIDLANPTLTFDITHSLGSMGISILNEGATGDVTLTGLINNPVGATTINAVGGSVLNTTGIVRTATFNSDALNIGSAATRLNLELVRTTNLSPGGVLKSAGDVYLDVTGRLRDLSETVAGNATFTLDSIEAAGTVDVTLEAAQKEATTTWTAGALSVSLAGGAAQSYSSHFRPDIAVAVNVGGGIVPTAAAATPFAATYNFGSISSGSIALAAADSAVAATLVNITAATNLTDTGTGGASALTNGNIIISETSGDLRIGALTSTAGDVTASATVGIFDTNGADGTTAYITAKKITLAAGTGGIGSAMNVLEIDSTTLVDASADLSIFVKETAGDMNVGGIVSRLADVSLATIAGGILDADDDVRADVQGRNIDLTVLGGGIGTAANGLEINGAGTGQVQDALLQLDANIPAVGRLVATAQGSMFIAETIGGMNVLLATTTVGSIRLSANDSAGRSVIVSGQPVVVNNEDVNFIATSRVSAPAGVTVIAGDGVYVAPDAEISSAATVLIRVDARVNPLEVDPDVADGGTLEIAGDVVAPMVTIEGGSGIDFLQLTNPNGINATGVTEVFGLGADDRFFVNAVAGTTTLKGGDGADRFYTSSGANKSLFTLNGVYDDDAVKPYDVLTGTLAKLGGLSIETGAGTANTQDGIYLSSDASTANLTGALVGNTITGLGITGAITYTAAPSATGAVLFVKLGQGDDTMVVKDLAANIWANIYGGDGADTLSAGNDLNAVTGISGIVNFEGQGGVDTLLVRGDGVAAAGLLTEINVTGLGMGTNQQLAVHNTEFGADYTVTAPNFPGAIYYAKRNLGTGVTTSTVENVNVQLGTGADVFAVDGTNSFSKVTILGGAGADTITVGSTADGLHRTTIRRVEFVAGKLHLDGQGGADTITVDTGGIGTGIVGSYVGNEVRGLNMPATGGIIFDAPDDINVILGVGNDTFFVPSAAAGLTVQILTGDGFDKTYLGTVEGALTTGTLDDIKGTIIVNSGGPQADDVLYINDQSTTAAQTYTISNVVMAFDETTVTRTGMDAGKIIYKRTEGVILSAGSGADTINIEGTHREQSASGLNSTFTVNAGGGADTVNVGTPVTGGFSLDSFRIDTGAATYRGIPLIVNGQGGIDTVHYKDTASTVGTNLAIANKPFSTPFGLAGSPGVADPRWVNYFTAAFGEDPSSTTYSQVALNPSVGTNNSPLNGYARLTEHVKVSLGSGNDVAQVFDGTYAYDTTVFGGPGHETFNVGNGIANTGKKIIFNGEDGDDLVFTKFTTGVPNATTFVEFNGGAGTDTLRLAGDGISTGTYTPSATEARSGLVVARGNTFAFTGVEPLVVHGLLRFDLVSPDQAAELTISSVRVADLNLTELVLHELTIDGVVSWTQRMKFEVPAALDAKHMGAATAISGDTLVVGSEQENAASGAVFVYKWDGSGWVEQAKLYASDRGSAGQGFGKAVAIEGDTLIVGSPSDNTTGSNSGAAYVFTRTNGVWTQQVKLRADNGAAGATFGQSVTIGASTAFIGAAGGTTDSVYVFNKEGATWRQKQILTLASDADSDFGASVAFSSGTAVIGAPLAGATDAGAAFVYTLSGTTWTSAKTLVPVLSEAGENFGAAVDIDAGKIIVGSPLWNGQRGRAVIFEGAGADWARTSQLSSAAGLPQNEIAAEDQAGSRFGKSVSIDGAYAVVGAPGYNLTSLDQGAAYGFYQIADSVLGFGASWARASGASGSGRMMALTPEGSSVGVSGPYATADNFGASVAVGGGRIVVGQPGHNSGGRLDLGAISTFTADGTLPAATQESVRAETIIDPLGTLVTSQFGTVTHYDAATRTMFVGDAGAGKVYVYANEGLSWPLIATLAPASATGFGADIDVDGHNLVIGSPGSNQAFVYKRTGENWEDAVVLVPQTLSLANSAGSNFGASVAISGSNIVVGIPDGNVQYSTTGQVDANYKLGLGAAGGAVTFKLNTTTSLWAQDRLLLPDDVTLPTNTSSTETYVPTDANWGQVLVQGMGWFGIGYHDVGENNGRTITLMPHMAIAIVDTNGGDWDFNYLYNDTDFPVDRTIGSGWANDIDDLIVGSYTPGAYAEFVVNGSTRRFNLGETRLGSTENNDTAVTVGPNTIVMVADISGGDARQQSFTSSGTMNSDLDNDVEGVGVVSTVVPTKTRTKYESFSFTGAKWGSSVDIVNGIVFVGAPGKSRVAMYDLATADTTGWSASIGGVNAGGTVVGGGVTGATLTGGVVDGALRSTKYFDAAAAAKLGTEVVAASATKVFVGSPGMSTVQVYNKTTTWTAGTPIVGTDGFGGDESITIRGGQMLIGSTGTVGSSNLFTSAGVTLNKTFTPFIYTQVGNTMANDTNVALKFGAGGQLISEGVTIIGTANTTADENKLYVFRDRGPAFTGLATELSPELPTSSKGGSGVAIDGNTAVIGASGFDGRGAAYVYTSSAPGVWTLQATLQPSGLQRGDDFGATVALAGDSIIIGAPMRDAGGLVDSGGVYVYQRLGTGWTLKADVGGDAANARLGQDVDIYGINAIAGAPGAEKALVLTHDGATWGVSSTITTSWPGQFGAAVAIEGNTAIIGSPTGNANKGVAQVYTNSGATWNAGALLDAREFSNAGDRFGAAVDFSGGLAVIGAPGFANSTGAVFPYFTGSWGFHAQINGVAAGDFFGSAVAVDGDMMIVGAYGVQVPVTAPVQTRGDNEGSAYVYRYVASSWVSETSIDALTGSDAFGGDNVGYAVALSKGNALIGAPQLGGRVNNTTTPGAGYAFMREVSAPITVTTVGSQSTLQLGAQANIIGGKVGTMTTADLKFFDIRDFNLTTGSADDLVTLGSAGLTAYGLRNFNVTTGGGNDTFTTQTNLLKPTAAGTFLPSVPFTFGSTIPANTPMARVLGALTFDGGTGTNTMAAVFDGDWTVTANALIGTKDNAAVTLTNVSNVTLTGGGSVNRFTLLDWSGTATLDGGGDSDQFIVHAAALNGTKISDTTGSLDSLTVLGTAGIDTFQVNAGRVRLNNTMDLDYTNGGVDLLNIAGGLGDDILTVNDSSAGFVFLDGEDGSDTYQVFAGATSAKVFAHDSGPLPSDTANVDKLELPVSRIPGLDSTFTVGAKLVTFDETIEDMGTAELVFDPIVTATGSAGPDNIVLSGSTLTINGVPLDISMITELTIDAADGDDIITIDAFSAPLLTKLIINGGNGKDKVILTLPLPTGPSYALNGGADDDILELHTGSGNDMLTLGATSVQLDGSPSANFTDFSSFVVDTGDGADVVTLDGVTGPVTVNTGDADDIVKYGALVARATINAGRGNDRVIPLSLASGGFGLTFNGGDGNDYFEGTTSDDIADGGLGEDTLLGGDGADTLLGGAGNNFLNGGGGADSITGGSDSDTIIGGAGNDVFNGGGGGDLYTFADGWGADSFTGVNSGSGAFDFSAVTTAITFASSGTTITATSGADSITFSDSQPYITSVSGGAGDDIFNVTNTGGTPVVLNGGNGSDQYIVTLGALNAAVQINDTGTVGSDTVTIEAPAPGYTIDVRQTSIVATKAGLAAQVINFGTGIENITVNAKANGGSTVNVAEAISFTGNVRLAANQAFVNNTINAGGIRIDSALGLDLNADINARNNGNVSVFVDGGAITLNEDINSSSGNSFTGDGSGTIQLVTNGGAILAGNSTAMILAGSGALLLRGSNGSIGTLTTPIRTQVGTLAAATTGAGTPINIYELDGLIVGTVAGTPGITSTGGTVQIFNDANVLSVQSRIAVAGDLTLTSDQVDIAADIASPGSNFFIRPEGLTTVMAIGDGVSGVFVLSQSEINHFVNGFLSIQIGQELGRNLINLGNASFVDPTLMQNPVLGGHINQTGILNVTDNGSFTIYGSGHTTELNNQNVGGNIDIVDSAVVREGETVTLTSLAGSININFDVDGTLGGADETLVLNAAGDVTVKGAIGSEAQLGTLRIANGTNVRFEGSVNVKNLIIEDGATFTVDGTLNAQSIAVSGVAAATFKSSVILTTGLTTTGGALSTIVFEGQISAPSVSVTAIQLADFYQLVDVTTALNVTTTSATGDIVFRQQVNSHAGNITVNSQDDVTFIGPVAGANLTVTRADATSFQGPLELTGAFVRTLGTGTASFALFAAASANINATGLVLGGTTTLTGAAGLVAGLGANGAFTAVGAVSANAGPLNITGKTINFQSGVSAASSTLSAIESITVANASLFTTTGALSATTTSGTVGEIKFTGPTTVGGVATFTTPRALTFQNTLNVTSSLTVAGATSEQYQGAVVVGGAFVQTSTVTGATSFSSTLQAGSLDLQAGSLAFTGDVNSSGNATLTAKAGSISAAANVVATGTLTMSATTNVGLLGATSASSIGVTAVGTITAGVGGMTTTSGAISLTTTGAVAGNSVTLNGLVDAETALTINAARGVLATNTINAASLNATGTALTFNSLVTTTGATTLGSTGAINLVSGLTAGGNLLVTGASAVTLGDAVTANTVNITAANTIDISVGGLASTVGGITLATTAPGAGNSVSALGLVDASTALTITTPRAVSLNAVDAASVAVSAASINLSSVVTATGGVTLTADASGNISAGSTITAGGALNISRAKAVTFEGLVNVGSVAIGSTSIETVSIGAGGMTAAGDLIINTTVAGVGNGITSQGTLTAGANNLVSLVSVRGVDISGAINGSDLTASGTTVTLRGVLTLGDDVTLSATGALAVNSDLTAGGDLVVSQAGALAFGAKVNAATLTVSNAGNTIFSGQTTITNAATLTLTGDLTTAAQFAVGGALNVPTVRDVSFGGLVTAASASIGSTSARTISVNNGGVQTTGALTLRSTDALGTININGPIAAANGATTLTAAGVVNSVAGISGDTVTVTASSMSLGGAVNADAGNVTLNTTVANAGSIIVGGVVTSTGSLLVGTTTAPKSAALNGALNIGSDLTVRADETISTGAQVTVVRDISFTTTSTTAGEVRASGTLSAGRNFLLDTSRNATFLAPVTVGGAATITKAAALQFDGALNVTGALTQTAGLTSSRFASISAVSIAIDSPTIAVTNAVTATSGAANFNAAASGKVTIGGNMSIAGALTVPRADEVILSGNVSASTVNVGATSVRTISFGTNLTATTGDVTLDGNGGPITVAGTLTTPTALSIPRGTVITLNSAVSAASATIAGGAFTAGNDITTTTGALTFTTTGNVTVVGKTTAAQTLSITGAADVNLTGAVSARSFTLDANSFLAGSTFATTNGNAILTTDANIRFVGVANVNGALTVTTALNTTFQGQLTVTGALTQQDGFGATRFDGPVSASDIFVRTAQQVFAGNAFIANTGNIFIESDEIDFFGGTNAVQGTAALTLRPYLAATSIDIGSPTPTGLLDLSDVDLNALRDGFTQITIGRSEDGTGAMLIGSSVFKDNVAFHAGSITVESNTLVGQVVTTPESLTMTARTGSIVTNDDIFASDVNFTAVDNVAINNRLEVSGLLGINPLISVSAGIDDTGSIFINGTVLTTNHPNSTLFARTGNVAGDIRITGTIGGIGLAILMAPNGEILQTSGNVSASFLDTVAETGITLLTTADHISARVTGTGDIYITDTGAAAGHFLDLGSRASLNDGLFTADGDITVYANESINAYRVEANGDVTIESGAEIYVDDVTGDEAVVRGTILLVEDRDSNGENMLFDGNVRLLRDITLNSDGGNITITGAVNATPGQHFSLTIEAGGGDVTIGNGIGSVTPIEFLQVNDAGLFTLASGSRVEGDTEINASAIAISAPRGSIVSTMGGALRLLPVDSEAAIDIGSPANGSAEFSLSDAELAALGDGFGGIQIGQVGGRHNVKIESARFLDDLDIYADNVSLLTSSIAQGVNGLSAVNGSDDNDVRIHAITSFTQGRRAGIVAGRNGDIVITANEITLDPASTGLIRGFGELLVQPHDATRSITLGGAGPAGAFDLTANEFSALGDTFSRVIIGRENGAHVINITRDLKLRDTTLIRTPMNGGSVLIGSDLSSVTVQTLGRSDSLRIESAGDLIIGANLKVVGSGRLDLLADVDGINGGNLSFGQLFATDKVTRTISSEAGAIRLEGFHIALGLEDAASKKRGAVSVTSKTGDITAQSGSSFAFSHLKSSISTGGIASILGTAHLDSASFGGGTISGKRGVNISGFGAIETVGTKIKSEQRITLEAVSVTNRAKTAITSTLADIQVLGDSLMGLAIIEGKAALKAKTSILLSAADVVADPKAILKAKTVTITEL